MEAKKEQEGNVRLLYEENGRTYRYFLEWRHKVLIRLAVTTGVVAYLAKELYAEGNHMPPVFTPLLFVFLAGSALMCVFMDEKNKRMLSSCESAGSLLEKLLLDTDSEALFYTVQKRDESKLVTYNNILRFAYVAMVLIGLGAAAVSVVNPPQRNSSISISTEQVVVEQPATAPKSDAK